MKTIVNTINNLTRDILCNTGLYKVIYANELTSNDISKKIYFIHSHGIICRKITKLTDIHFTHSGINDFSKAEVLISHYNFPMYIDISRDKLLDTTTRIILDNNAGNQKPDSVLSFFSNRDLVLYASKFLE